MKKIFKIAIPKPCQENWENMTPNEKGRHCANCNKTVIDFSLFTDKQLIEFFNNAVGSVCGRFHSYQLNRELVYIEPRNHFLYKLLFGTALTLGIAGSASANSLQNMKPLMEHYGLKNENNREENPVAGGDSTNYVKGKMIDKRNKEPLPFGEVMLLHNKTIIGTAFTDTSGAFKITVPQAYIGKKLSLTSMYLGYNSDTVSINGANLPVTIELQEKVMELGGPMLITIPGRYEDSSDPLLINTD